MCEYQFEYLTEGKAAAYCSISSYFSYWKYMKGSFSEAPAEWSSEIPVDIHGHCLFHSRDIQWKLNHHFYSRFLQLLNILSELAIHATVADQELVVNMRECCFVGNAETGDCQGSPIVLKDLDFFQAIHLDFQHSVFEDSFCIRNAQIKQVSLDFSYCQFKDRLQLYETQIRGLRLSSAHLNGGLLINHCSIYKDFSANHLQAKGIFDLSSSTFFKRISLQEICLSARFLHVKANHFHATVSFNGSKIASDTYFSNNHFDKDVLFKQVDFQHCFSFSGNTVKGNIRLSSLIESHPEASTQGIHQQYHHTSLSTYDRHSNASQLSVITQKINAISKRIRRTKDQASQSQLVELALPDAIYSREGTIIATANEAAEVDFDRSNFMENERENFHAFLSFAEEDAETAAALYQALVQYGLNVWFSKIHLGPGESIINTINQAINNSRSGIVLISPNTFNDHKHFPRLELNSLLTRDLYQNKPFFPVYHEITPEQVAEHLILIGDRLATDTTDGMDKAARRLFEALKKQEVL